MRIHTLSAVASAPLLALATFVPRAGFAQGVAQRSPNLANTWAPTPGVVQLNFTHRFEMSKSPLRKITNTPSFQVATGLVPSLGVGFTYGSNSDLVSAYPNEWELFARWTPWSQDSDAPLETSLQAGWNIAAESFDAELSAARALGPLRVLVAGRAFHHAFYRDRERYAVAGGAALRLSPWLAIAGDYATLFDRADAERPAWSAGLQLSIPYTPHSMSIHASNVGTGSLEGASRGSRTRWGFEYTVPITLRRYAPRRAPSRPVVLPVLDSSSTRIAESGMPTPDTVIVIIQKYKYQTGMVTVKAGDVVVWRNLDVTEHTLTADSGAFESPLIRPGERWSFRFATAGTFAYHCMPHPFMKAEILVRKATP